jgi:hypothetical protein
MKQSSGSPMTVPKQRSDSIHRKFPVLALAATVLFYVVAGPGVLCASAEPAFSNSSLKGSYGVLLNKWTSSSTSKPEVLVGVFDFDGAGNISITSFTDNNGVTITTGTGSGTYSVKKNGTGSMSVNLSNGDSGGLSLVLDAKGKGFQMILTNCQNGCGSGVLSGTAVATGGTSFSNASLKGGYEFLTAKWPSQQSASAQNDLGIFTFDGAGNVKASITEDKAGKVTTITASGNYSVNSDGSGSMSLTGTQGSFTFAFAINTAGKGSQLIMTTGGGGDTVQSGTITQQ